MRLTPENAQLVWLTPDGDLHHVNTVAEASGVRFQCPKCTDGHQCLIWFAAHPGGAPVADKEDAAHLWAVSGTNVTDLTLHPSINYDVGPEASCRWHGWVKNGDAT